MFVMNHAESHIPQSDATNFQDQITLIVKALDPVSIICYGVRTEIKELWSCFLNTSQRESRVHIDLLIITKEPTKAKEHESFDKINRICDAGAIQLLAVIHCVTAVKEALANGNAFFSQVFTKGEVVYQNDAASEAISLKVLTPLEIVERAKRHWTKWFFLGMNFYKSACESAQKKRSDVAVFLLHQSVELMSIAVITTCMGYKPSTHNLKRLFSIMENFTSDCIRIFPRSTNEEIELFDVLCKAYSEVRYKEEYDISAKIVSVLIGRVNLFQILAEKLYLSKVVELERHIDLTNEAHEAAPVKSNEPFTSVREINGFELIELNTFAEVVLIKGEKESVLIESAENTEKAIQTSVKGKRLLISTISEGQRILPASTIYITYLILKGLTVHHVHALTCRGPIESSKLGILQNCKRNINLAVDVQVLDVTLTKAGNVNVIGSTGDLNVRNHGSGTFDGSDLSAESVNVIVRGSGNVLVRTDDELIVALEGTGSVFYAGMPRLRSIVNNGEGKLKKLSHG